MTVSAPALLTRRFVVGVSLAAVAAGIGGIGGAGATPVAAASPTPAVPGSAGQPATATVCADETHRWGGDMVIAGPGDVFDTGVDVPPAAGDEVSVVGVSADGLDSSDRAHVLAVRVGGMSATAGAAIAGGRVTVTNTVDASLGPVRVVGVTVVVRRCETVASAAAGAPGAPPAIAVSNAPAAPGAGVAPVPASSGSVATGPGARGSSIAASGAMLPATGGAPWHQSVIGALMVAFGFGLVSMGRRTAASAPRVTVAGREPGSPPDVRRPARG